MPDLKMRNGPIVLLVCIVWILSPVSSLSGPGQDSGTTLSFDAEKYVLKTFNLGDKAIAYRAYEGIVYVSNPVDVKYQSMNFYVPAEYYESETIGSYTVETAPIFFQNSVGGYMPGMPGSPGLNRRNLPNAIAVALSMGCVVAAPGARGRTLKDETGLFTGKAPACIVDLKAAVRYLRYNDKIMPGDAEKIISNGTSAGGALSALLGATGNNPDYVPFLQAVGAAEERDDIFAASCYCPITNLENADAAYEWQFHGINEFDRRGEKSIMTAEQNEISGRLKALFPCYVNGLGLKGADGIALVLDSNGEGSFKDHVKSFLIASAQKALDEGADLSGLSWLLIRNNTVLDIDFDRFAAHATRMKPAPAFDSMDLRSPENSLFGSASIENRHFTRFSSDQSPDHALADASIVKMMNPMNYIGAQGTITARHWRIRHGAMDRDTSFAIPVILSTKLGDHGCNVDFAMPWEQGHGGDYDLDSLFAWIGEICR